MSKGATVLQPDTLLFGKYQIVSAIGEGGYGQVYLAHDLAMNRRVAIKELLRDVATQDDARWQRFQARFRREAQTVGQFEHPNVVGAHALESDAEGNLYLVLEYVEGGSLEEALNAGAPLKTERALAIATDICRAIDAIYRRDIVHRDIKPSNILLVAEPAPGGAVAKLTDFGIAQVGRDTRRTQDVVPHPGTPAYMSPEQATTSGYLDQRSDLYALGLVLYEMLTGESYVRNLVSPRERNLAVPASLDAVVMRALRDDPAERYQSAAEMLSDLQHVRDQSLLGQLGILLRAIRPRQIAAWVGVLLVGALLYGSLR
ncbi:MAG: serine/threonine protein kinase, partial [Chloroflexi bacterium]|nr:serine/threonine protein kinase [Chloroflexota bacterium]